MELKRVATGHPLTLVFTDLVPGHSYHLKLSGGNFFTGHVAPPTQEQPVPSLSKYEFGFTASQKQAEFVAGVALVHGLVSGVFHSGDTDAARCQMHLRDARWSGEDGEFALDTGLIPAPPTCASLGCGPWAPNCPPPYKGCYGYMGVFWCCIDPPYGS